MSQTFFLCHACFGKISQSVHLCQALLAQFSIYRKGRAILDSSTLPSTYCKVINSPTNIGLKDACERQTLQLIFKRKRKKVYISADWQLVTDDLFLSFVARKRVDSLVIVSLSQDGPIKVAAVPEILVVNKNETVLNKTEMESVSQETFMLVA